MKENTSTLVVQSTLEIHSEAFKHMSSIPMKYSCEGKNINPPLEIGKIPQACVSLALIMEDPDAPGKVFDHWLVWNITPGEAIHENSIPGKTGKNSKGEKRYTGPCPPSGTHRYFFKIYALDTLLDIDGNTDKQNLEHVIQSHIIAYGELIGLYKKQG